MQIGKKLVCFIVSIKYSARILKIKKIIPEKKKNRTVNSGKVWGDISKKVDQDRKNKTDKNENIDPQFLEKILLDFGVSGNVKKVSHGPVVTLNEFEPAAGIKVSKIVNSAKHDTDACIKSLD